MEGFVVTKVTFHIFSYINNCITTTNELLLHLQKKLIASLLWISKNKWSTDKIYVIPQIFKKTENQTKP